MENMKQADQKAVAEVRELLFQAWKRTLQFPSLSAQIGLGKTITKAADLAILCEVGINQGNDFRDAITIAKRLKRKPRKKESA